MLKGHVLFFAGAKLRKAPKVGYWVHMLDLIGVEKVPGYIKVSALEVEGMPEKFGWYEVDLESGEQVFKSFQDESWKADKMVFRSQKK